MLKVKENNNQNNNHASSCDLINTLKINWKNVKDIIDSLLIDEHNFYNSLISDYITSNISSFRKNKKLSDWQKKIYYNEVIEIDFSWLSILNDLDFNDWLVKTLLVNIIKDSLWIKDSNFHEVHYWKKENNFCVFNYKNEVKRYKWYSEDTMDSITSKFIDWMDFYGLVKNRIDKEFDLSKMNEFEIRSIYEWSYKKIIIKLIKEEIFNVLPNIVKENIEDDVLVWMVQYYYRVNFDNLNKVWLDKLDNTIEKWIENKYESDNKIKNNILFDISWKINEYTIEEIFNKWKINEYFAKDVFENIFLEIVDFRVNYKKDQNHNFINNWSYFRKRVYEYIFNYWLEYFIKYSQDILSIKMDYSLAKMILWKNIIKRWIWSFSFELSKNIFKYLSECCNDNTKLTIKEWFYDFFDNFDWGIDKYWEQKNIFNPVVLKKEWIDIESWFWKNFFREFESLLSRDKSLELHNFNVKNNSDKQNIINRIKDTTDWFNLRYVTHDPDLLSESEYIVYHLIKEFSLVILK